MVMSNELSTAKILFCPSDNIHTSAATNFGYGELLGIVTPANSNATPAPQLGENRTFSSKISYFINGDAPGANPQDILTGDDNIGNDSATSASATAAYRFGASSAALEASVFSATAACNAGITSLASSGVPWWSWTAGDFHRASGILGFADGSCQPASIAGLHNYLAHSTNSVVGEAVNFMP
jgi:hypothetical protein